MVDLISLGLGALITILVALIIFIIKEKLTFKSVDIKAVRVLAIDSDVPKTFFNKSSKRLLSNPFFKDMKIFSDYPSNPSIIESLSGDYPKILIKRNIREVDGYETKKSERKVACIDYRELLKMMDEFNKNEKVALILLTTYPIWDRKEKDCWIGAGSFEKTRICSKRVFNKISFLLNEIKSKIVIIPYSKKDFLKDKKEVLDTIEHELAHLFGIENYKFVC